MKTNWDLKSLLVGTILGAAALVLIGAATPPTHPPTPEGRFQVASGESGAFVVDTATGQVWRWSGSPKPDAFTEPKIVR